MGGCPGRRGGRCSRGTGGLIISTISPRWVRSPPEAMRACAPSRTSWSSPRLWIGSVFGSSARPSWLSCTDAACPATASDDMRRDATRDAALNAMAMGARVAAHPEDLVDDDN